MIMREKIAEIIRGGELVLSYHGIADAIIAAMPDYDAQQARITKLEAARDLGIIEGDVVAQLLVVAQQAQIERLEAELHMMKEAGVIEVAVRNSSVSEYMAHWEGRTEKADARIKELEATLMGYQDAFCEHGGDLCGRLKNDSCRGCRAATALKGEKT